MAKAFVVERVKMPRNTIVDAFLRKLNKYAFSTFQKSMERFQIFRSLLVRFGFFQPTKNQLKRHTNCNISNFLIQFFQLNFHPSGARIVTLFTREQKIIYGQAFGSKLPHNVECMIFASFQIELINCSNRKATHARPGMIKNGFVA